MSNSTHEEYCSGRGYWDTGKCRCYAGWNGDSCNSNCLPGTYGIGCINLCTCGENASCDVFTGKCTCKTNSTCIQCKYGLYGPSCSIPCICGDESCKSDTGDCILKSSDNVGAATISAITLGVLLGIILFILCLILMWNLWNQKHFLKKCRTFKPREQEDIEDTLNDFDIIYEFGSGRNSIDTDVGSITSSNKMFPTRVVQERELPGIPEEDEGVSGGQVQSENVDDNELDRVEHWQCEKPVNSSGSISLSVKAVHGSVRSNVDIHTEPKATKASPHKLNSSEIPRNINDDSTSFEYHINGDLERALLSEDYMELRRSIENLTAVISQIPLAVSQGSSCSVSLVGRSDSSSDQDEYLFRSVPSINVSDQFDEMNISGSEEIESKSGKRKRKRTSVHNYLSVNTGNLSTSSDEEPATVYDNTLDVAFNIDTSGNESDSKGYNKVDRTKRSYSREIAESENEYDSLQISVGHSSSLDKVYTQPRNEQPKDECDSNYLETKVVNLNKLHLTNEVSGQKINIDDQYLQVRITENNKESNAAKSNIELESKYLETIPFIKKQNQSVKKLEKNENKEFLKSHSTEEVHSRSSDLKITNEPESAFTLEKLENSKKDQKQSITIEMKSKIPIRVNKKYSI
ncbi:uncharacterized protein [Antedon mediterranea]|uniref:uncharacterized protein n=1 Tax=Antedon mediterranea TaxID=105859 RepID=UPI003AF9B01D